MAGIQSRGVASTIAGFSNLNCDYWAIFEGRYLRFKGEGDDSLQKVLNNLQKSGSEATYILCGYEDKIAKITASTPCDGSFNFKIFSSEEMEERNPRSIAYEERRSVMMAEIGGIKEELRLLREQQLQPEEPQQRLGIIGELMESPLGPVIGNILQSWFVPGSVVAGMGSIGNIPKQQQLKQPATAGTTENDVTDIIKRLIAHDPKMVDRFRMLLDLADTDKTMFNMVMSQFDKLS